mgnify:FL=1
MTACAVHTRAGSTALALAIVLGRWSIHDKGLDVALSLNDKAVSLLHALAFVSAIAVTALVRHDE